MGCPSELCRLIIVMPVTARLSGSIPREGDYKDSNPFAHPEVAMGRAPNARRHLATPKGSVVGFVATRRSGALVSVIGWLAHGKTTLFHEINPASIDIPRGHDRRGTRSDDGARKVYE